MALFKKKQPIVVGSRDPKQGWKESRVAGHGTSHDESNWLVSYADMMTLLCGFFILLFSMAKLDPPKYEKMKEEVAKQFGGQYQVPATNELAEFFKTAVQDMGIADKTVVKSDPLSVTVAFQSTMFFDTLSADVKPEGRALLQRMIAGISDQGLKSNKKYRVAVEGHTDSRPVLGGVYPSNWELAGARASNVARMFIERGFDPRQLTSISYGDTRPEVEARTPAGTLDEAALAKNRRVVLRIMDPRVEAIPFPDAAANSAQLVAPATAVAAALPTAPPAPVTPVQTVGPAPAAITPPAVATAPIPAPVAVSAPATAPAPPAH